jgi:hypothetical protein
MLRDAVQGDPQADGPPRNVRPAVFAVDGLPDRFKPAEVVPPRFAVSGRETPAPDGFCRDVPLDGRLPDPFASGIDARGVTPPMMPLRGATVTGPGARLGR